MSCLFLFTFVIRISPRPLFPGEGRETGCVLCCVCECLCVRLAVYQRTCTSACGATFFVCRSRVLGKATGIGIVMACGLIHMLQPGSQSLTDPSLGWEFTTDYPAYSFLFAMLASGDACHGSGRAETVAHTHPQQGSGAARREIKGVRSSSWGY